MSDIITKLATYNAALKRELEVFPVRNIAKQINWSDRLIGIWGPKGVGKTTLLLSKLAEISTSPEKTIYLSMDHPQFSGVSLVELAETFYQAGGETLLLDEVHKYEDWSSHLKAIFDAFKNLKIVFSGSSALHLQQGQGDLSRRASMYKLPILSFREFLTIESKHEFVPITFPELLKDHRDVTARILQKVKPLAFFQKYLEYGAYPFYQEGVGSYHQKLVRVISHTLDSDLVFIHGLDARFSTKLKTLMRLVATSVPFVPKITDLAQSTGLSRPTVSQYLEYLEEGGLISLLRPAGRGYQKLSKPEKIYLDNTNLQYALGRTLVEVGTTRETFCASQLREAGCMIESHSRADFLVDGKHVIEVGGKNKDHVQIKDTPNSYLFCDEIEQGNKEKVPLWLAGFLY